MNNFPLSAGLLVLSSVLSAPAADDLKAFPPAEKGMVRHVLQLPKQTSTHGSPWRYDTFVPVVFAGGKLTAQRIYRAIEPLDIAPTLAALIGAKPPSGSRGVPLAEIMQDSAR